MQAIALQPIAMIVCVAALAVSVRYFLSSRPAHDGPVDPSRLLFGRIHPQVLLRALIAAAMTYVCWLLSNAAAAQGDRILAGLILAAAAPAVLALALTLFALVLVLLPAKPARPTLAQGAVTLKSKIAARFFLIAIIVGAALLPILR